MRGGWEVLRTPPESSKDQVSLSYKADLLTFWFSDVDAFLVMGPRLTFYFWVFWTTEIYLAVAQK